jgi:hypothetical protein
MSPSNLDVGSCNREPRSEPAAASACSDRVLHTTPTIASVGSESAHQVAELRSTRSPRPQAQGTTAPATPEQPAITDAQNTCNRESRSDIAPQDATCRRRITKYESILVRPEALAFSALIGMCGPAECYALLFPYQPDSAHRNSQNLVEMI